jgi:hypothetical protein
LPQDLLAGLSIERRIEGWRGELSEPRHATFVRTTPEGAVVGVCNAGSNRRDSPLSHREVYAIYVLDGAKRKGLGCALFIEATAWLKQNDKLGAWPRCTGPKTPAIL